MIFKTIKRVLEVFAALLLLILLSPFMCAAAIAVKSSSPGPAVFKQKRLGLGGRPFILYKFRTMYCNTDPMGTSPKESHDRRVTPVGRFLRRTAVDEWPQFFNILKGDMSFVGPRPQLKKELEPFARQYPQLWNKRLSVRPGLTCWWAITPNRLKIKPTVEMLEADCRYVDQASFWQDLKIFFLTFTYLLSKSKR